MKTFNLEKYNEAKDELVELKKLLNDNVAMLADIPDNEEWMTSIGEIVSIHPINGDGTLSVEAYLYDKRALDGCYEYVTVPPYIFIEDDVERKLAHREYLRVEYGIDRTKEENEAIRKIEQEAYDLETEFYALEYKIKVLRTKADKMRKATK